MIPINSDGNLLQDYANDLKGDAHLVVMPVARVFVEWSPCAFPQSVTFYPAGTVDTGKLRVAPNGDDSSSPDEQISSASGVDEDVLSRHSLVVFPHRFDWTEFRKSSHRQHLEFIRKMSDHVDRACLDFIRYRQCPIFTNGDPIHNLPGRAGQLDTNHMMAGALLYNHALREARMIGGDAFTHIVTRGLGLALADIDSNEFPKQGGVGFIVSHALSLYTTMLEANSPTSFFVQALSLLEFLAYPDDYALFKEVKKVIARYVAKNQSEYNALLERFFELTAKKEEVTGHIIGYRTRLVHMGQRIEDIVPDAQHRKELFYELDGYIRPVIDHMIQHSDMTFVEYLKVRETLRPYEI